MASVTLQHVSKRFGDVEAVRDVSLEVPDGGFLALVGPSGCGKTTVLRLIAGLETPDAGTVHFDGQDLAAVSPRERNIAMVFEGYALYPHLAVRDNLAFAMRLRRTPHEEVSRRVSETAVAMDLEHLLGRRPGRLATGEAQHVAVGRAVIRETPAVLLLDDALSHLDAQQRLEARAEVGRLHRDLGCTVVSVTHEQAEALALGTLVAVMDEGVLKQVGPPHELYEQPADVFVAGFIGSPPMNLVEMELDRSDGREILRHASLEVTMPEWLRGSSRPSVIVGIRPEDICLGRPATTTEIGLRGSCELIEYLGSRLLVHVRVDDHEFVVIDDAADEIRAGDVVDCSAPIARSHLFDAGTGRALGARATTAA